MDKHQPPLAPIRWEPASPGSRELTGMRGRYEVAMLVPDAHGTYDLYDQREADPGIPGRLYGVLMPLERAQARAEADLT